MAAKMYRFEMRKRWGNNKKRENKEPALAKQTKSYKLHHDLCHGHNTLPPLLSGKKNVAGGLKKESGRAGSWRPRPTNCVQASKRATGYLGLVFMRTRLKRRRGPSHSVSEKQTAGLHARPSLRQVSSSLRPRPRYLDAMSLRLASEASGSGHGCDGASRGRYCRPSQAGQEPPVAQACLLSKKTRRRVRI